MEEIPNKNSKEDLKENKSNETKIMKTKIMK